MPLGERAWLATRYADVRLVLGDNRFSRTEVLRHDEHRLCPLPASGGLLAMDPPWHTRLRGFVGGAFTARRAEHSLPRPRVQALCSSLRRRSTCQNGAARGDGVAHAITRSTG